MGTANGLFLSSSHLHCSPCLQQDYRIPKVLRRWRESGRESALQLFNLLYTSTQIFHGTLNHELYCRLNQLPAPRLMIDGVWFSRPYGGISRVWNQILSTLNLDGFLSSQAPAICIVRGAPSLDLGFLQSLSMPSLDPLNLSALRSSASSSAMLANSWQADVFLSSWITSCDPLVFNGTQIGLLHDCIPERSSNPDSNLLHIRREWILRCSNVLSVSSSTATDLRYFFSGTPNSAPWCHPCPSLYSHLDLIPSPPSPLPDSFYACINDISPFLLLTGTSSIGSYKNPEAVARALHDTRLSHLSLLITGINASFYARSLEQKYPVLRGRIHSFGCSNTELIYLYQNAFAVVIPSRIEGFGLPALEALLFSTTPVITADSPGLREAAGEAALRFHPDRPDELANLLSLFLEPTTSSWLQRVLSLRRLNRISAMSSDLLGLSLCALARSSFDRSLTRSPSHDA